jgi:hypothetical protein
MSYAVPPVIDKQLRGKLLMSVLHWRYRRGCTPEDTATALKLEISFFVAATNRQHREWRGNPDAEKGIREAPENQEWMNALIKEAVEGAEAVQAQIVAGV